MLLEDIELNKSTKFKKINSFLRKNFGFTLSEDTDVKSLMRIRKEVMANVARLKVQENMSATNPEFAKNLLILEGVELMLGQKQQLAEYGGNSAAYTKSKRYQNVLTWIADYVVKNVEVGDDLDQAVEQAMREYRSSKWRWPDYEVEFDARKIIKTRLAELEGEPELGMEAVIEAEVDEDEDPIEEAEYSIDDSGRNVADDDTRKRAGKFLPKGPRGKSDTDWGNVTHSKGATEPKGQYRAKKQPKPGRGQKAVFDLPERKGTQR